MYIIEASAISGFLSGMGKKFRNYTRTFPARSITNIEDITFAATHLCAYGVPYNGRGGQVYPKVADMYALELILAHLIEKVWHYFNATPNTPNTQADFDSFHDDLCETFINGMRSAGYSPTYGNAQKMVNMLFKYLTCFSDYPRFASLFDHCHIPIDGRILGRFASTYHVPGAKGTLAHGKYDGVAWSKMDKVKYLALLDAYRTTLAPLKGSNSWLGLEYAIWVGGTIPTSGRVAIHIKEFYK